MLNKEIQIDKNLLASYTKEAQGNLISVFCQISQKILNTPLQAKGTLSSIFFLKDSCQLLPEQEMSMQKMMLQSFPAIKIILDKLLNSRIKKVNRRDVHFSGKTISYPFKDTKNVVKSFCRALDCLINNEEIQDTFIQSSLLTLLKSSFIAIRTKFKYESNKR